MVKMIDLLNDFDDPDASRRYMDSLAAEGVPYEYADENTVMVFDDEEDHAKWLELEAMP